MNSKEDEILLKIEKLEKKVSGIATISSWTFVCLCIFSAWIIFYT